MTLSLKFSSIVISMGPAPTYGYADRIPEPKLNSLSANLRRATNEAVPQLRQLVNDAYRELADLGLNFTGTFQDEEITRERMRDAEVYLLNEGEELIGSISLSIQTIEGSNHRCVYINQLAVRPDRKRQGYGSYLLDFAEQRAREDSIDLIRLDTAIPANHLVNLYKNKDYKITKEVQWDGKTYRSYIMEKVLSGDAHL